MSEENFEQLAGVVRSKCMRVVKVTANIPLAIADGEFDENNKNAKVFDTRFSSMFVIFHSYIFDT